MLWLETEATSNKGGVTPFALTVEVEELLRHNQVLNNKAGWWGSFRHEPGGPTSHGPGLWLYDKAAA